MKVLLVIDSLGSGGAQNQISILGGELVKHGYRVDIFTYYPQDFFKGRIVENKIKHFYFQKKDKIGWNVIKSLSNVMRKGRYDVILSFLETPSFYAVLAKKLSGSKSKIIISERTRTEGIGTVRMLKKRFVHSLSDWCVCNSHHERIFWQELLLKKKDRISTIYNSVDLERFYLKDTERAITKKLLVIGSVSHHKNGLCVIRAMKELKNNDKLDFSVTWVGEIVLNIRERKIYYEQMIKEIDEAGIQKHWNWQAPMKDVSLLMYEHDALILASVTEGLPNVVCEALSSGLPVFVSNILDHPRLVKHGERGFTFNPQKANELSKLIEYFYSMDKADLLNMRNNARNFSEEIFNSSVFVSKYIQVFNSVLK